MLFRESENTEATKALRITWQDETYKYKKYSLKNGRAYSLWRCRNTIDEKDTVSNLTQEDKNDIINADLNLINEENIKSLDAFLNEDPIRLTVKEDTQNKHRIGTNEYILGKSVITISNQKIFNILINNKNKIILDVNTQKDNVLHFKGVIKADEEVGYIPIDNGEIVYTNYLKYHFFKKGFHAVPYRKGS